MPIPEPTRLPKPRVITRGLVALVAVLVLLTVPCLYMLYVVGRSQIAEVRLRAFFGIKHAIYHTNRMDPVLPNKVPVGDAWLQEYAIETAFQFHDVVRGSLLLPIGLEARLKDPLIAYTPFNAVPPDIQSKYNLKEQISLVSKELGNLRNVLYVYVSGLHPHANSHDPDPLLESISRIRSLQTLALTTVEWETDSRQPRLSFLKQMRRLRCIGLHSCNLAPAEYRCIEDTKSLAVLSITESGLPALTLDRFPVLQMLNVVSSKGSTLTASNCPSLETVRLINWQGDGVALKNLPGLNKALIHMDDATSPKLELSELPNVQILALRVRHAATDELIAIGGMPNLRHLELRTQRLDPRVLSAIASLPKLQTIRLELASDDFAVEELANAPWLSTATIILRGPTAARIADRITSALPKATVRQIPHPSPELSH